MGAALVVGLIAAFITAYVVGHGYNPINDDQALIYVVTQRYWEPIWAFFAAGFITYIVVFLCGSKVSKVYDESFPTGYTYNDGGRIFYQAVRPERPSFFFRLNETLLMTIAGAFLGAICGVIVMPGILLLPIIWPIIEPLYDFTRNKVWDIPDIMFPAFLGCIIGAITGLIMGIIEAVGPIYTPTDITPQSEREPEDWNE